ncbi:MAG: hypothetical protein K6B41_11070 [Butyrivibrio sp.]|nr:hypothetical protein [Butyrivibrio sp.]
MKIVRKKKDIFGIILVTLMIIGELMVIGTLLLYLTFVGEGDSLIGTKYGTIVIVGVIITSISSLLRVIAVILLAEE